MVANKPKHLNQATGKRFHSVSVCVCSAQLISESLETLGATRFSLCVGRIILHQQRAAFQSHEQKKATKYTN